MSLDSPDDPGADIDLQVYEEKILSRLTEEQQRRYKLADQTPPSAKVEFIDGKLVFHPPTTLRHQWARARLSHLLSAYVAVHELGIILEENAFVALAPNGYQPDVAFYKTERANEFRQDQSRFPAPDLIVEVLCPAVEKLARGVKFRDYAAQGVIEYWLIDPTTASVEQYEAVEGKFSLTGKVSEGELTSRAIPGLKAPVRAFFDAKEHLNAMRSIFSGAPKA